MSETTAEPELSETETTAEDAREAEPSASKASAFF